MPRITKNPKRKERRKKILRQAKGYRGGRGTLYIPAREAVEKGLQHAYRDRRRKKREFRKLWITRINAAARENGLSYSRFIHGLKEAEVEINRKMLAELAVNDPDGFAELVETAKSRL
ncbi:MAG: 50S ribosomal protein L20 [Gemmatimonadota bacterium]|nr:50S ribosomal protein L20 [Gemmatimonadota bacterium]